MLQTQKENMYTKYLDEIESLMQRNKELEEIIKRKDAIIDALNSDCHNFQNLTNDLPSNDPPKLLFPNQSRLQRKTPSNLPRPPNSWDEER